jgi:hypothetical protein
MILRSIVSALLSFLTGFSAMTLAAMPLAAEPAQETAGVIGWINIEPSSGANGVQVLAITGRALALRPVHGRYSLEVKRKGKGGVSNARQGGAIDLQPGAAAVLSRNAINIGPADSIDVELKIFVDDREVFSAVVKSVGDDGALRL